MALLSSLLSKRAVQSSLYRQGFGNNVPAFRMVSAASSPQSPPPPSANPNPMHPDDLYQKRDEHFNKLSARYAYKESPYALGKHRSNALDLVMKVPPIEVDGDMAICDGGGGALGHPIEYIALDKPGKIGVCKYCSLRFIKKAH